MMRTYTRKTERILSVGNQQPTLHHAIVVQRSAMRIDRCCLSLAAAVETTEEENLWA